MAKNKIFMEGANVPKDMPTAKNVKPVVTGKSKIKSFEVDAADNGGFSVRVRPASTKDGGYMDSKTHVYESAAALCAWIEKNF